MPAARDNATPAIRIGCAGWSIAGAQRGLFGNGDGASVLHRYATRLGAVEINSSFHRPHRHATYAKWAQAVPPGFRFSVKLPRAITHDARLQRAGPLLDAFMAGACGLGDRLGVLLVQLPPGLAFDAADVARFFAMLRRRWQGAVACEPRHASWFAPGAEALLQRHRIARVAADPAPHPGAQYPGGDDRLQYWRWHGSPRTYYSAYEADALQQLRDAVLAPARDTAAPVGHAPETWVIFDNTAHGHAVPNALQLQALVTPAMPRRSR